MDYILDFCKECTILLPSIDQLEDGKCLNCYHSVIERSDRLQGVFSAEDGAIMLRQNFGEDAA